MGRTPKADGASNLTELKRIEERLIAMHKEADELSERVRTLLSYDGRESVRTSAVRNELMAVVRESGWGLYLAWGALGRLSAMEWDKQLLPPAKGETR